MCEETHMCGMNDGRLDSVSDITLLSALYRVLEAWRVGRVNRVILNILSSAIDLPFGARLLNKSLREAVKYSSKNHERALQFHI
jgi:hypothetical protein